MTLTFIIAFSLIGSVGCVAAAALVFRLPEGIFRRILPRVIDYAAGTLLGAAFLGLLPHAMEHLSPTVTLVCTLSGIFLFFIMEKLLIWRHCHKDECKVHRATGPLILVGDAFHNFVDGVIIAAAFLQSTTLGVATAIAVVAHEIPQELGDLMILVRYGYSKRRAFLLDVLSSLTTVSGAVLAYYLLASSLAAVPYIMAFSAASFMYIALVDLVPSQLQTVSLRESALQLLLMLLGVGTIGLFHMGH
jgi:zinc and cadmium transporter